MKRGTRAWPGLDMRNTVAIALGVLLLTDVLRVLLPSVITIFGSAGSTSAEELGAFALAWFVAPFVLLPLRHLVGARAFGLGAAVVLAGSRLVLLAVDGGAVQLYLSGVGIVAGICWLAAMAEAGHRPVPGVGWGIALAAAQHAAIHTVDLTWRDTWWAWLLAIVEAVVFVGCCAVASSEHRNSVSWFVVGPVLLLAGLFAASPAVLTTGYSYVEGLSDPGLARSGPWDLFLTVVILTMVTLAMASSYPPRSLVGRWVGALGLIGAAILFGYGPPVTIGLSVLIGAPSLGACLGLTADRSVRSRPRVRAAAGMLVFGVGTFAYYAAYDVGYPNGWVPVALALVVGAMAVRPGPAFVDDSDRYQARARIEWRHCVLAVVAVVAVVSVAWSPPPAVRPTDDVSSIRLVTYNIRMGFGLSGTFDPDAAARVIAGQRPDIVTLSEVDRGWLLNGGHDDLQVLADRLAMRYVFAPAADPLWGDAILTNLPVVRAASTGLTDDGAPTGAQALGVVVAVGGLELAVVSTHIQTPPGRSPLTQAREIAAFATGFGNSRPTVVAGDLNIEPGSASLAILTHAGFGDALAGARPVYTFPSDRPVEQIDHVLVRGGLTGSQVVVPASTASDHAPVAVTLTW